MHLIDDVVLERAGRLRAEADGVGFQHDAFRRLGARVEVSIQRSRREDGPVRVRRRRRIVRDLERVRVEQQFVRIEAVAVCVDVSHETDR